MKKIWKSLKWYFSHVNWLSVAIIFGLVLVVDFWDNGYFNWILLGGLLLFLAIVPLYGIIRSREAKEVQEARKKLKEIEKEQQKDKVIDYLSTMCHADRLELLKEVQEKTKGKE